MRQRPTSHRGLRTQRGAALVLILIAMMVLILTAGFALDVGHMMLSKTRLQDTADAAALSAAKTLDATSSTTLATQAALQAFGMNGSAPGNEELGTSYTNGSLQVTVQYSSTLPPFAPGSTTGPYVRVIATGFTFPTWLVKVAGIAQLGASASAVAGPSPVINTACNVAPMLVCGNPNADPATSFWGYTMNSPVGLKSSAPGSAQVGPGNFQLIQLGGTGGDVVRANMAGDYQSCIQGGSTVQTETGNETGPVAQGLNTRFGQYSGSMTMAQYPPDVVTTAVASPGLTEDSSGNIWWGSTEITSSNISEIYNYDTPESSDGADYLANEANGPYDYQPVTSGGSGIFNRRVLSVPIGNCTGTSNGSTSVQVLGFACFFLLQPVTQQGTTDYVIGQFVGNCGVDGTPGENPGNGPGPYVIQLYHDPGSGDS
jgi:Flp pilus assembly protein TadG